MVGEWVKPPFSVVAQGLLNLIKRKGLLQEGKTSLVFVTEETIEDFIRDAATNHP